MSKNMKILTHTRPGSQIQQIRVRLAKSTKICSSDPVEMSFHPVMSLETLRYHVLSHYTAKAIILEILWEITSNSSLRHPYASHTMRKIHRESSELKLSYNVM